MASDNPTWGYQRIRGKLLGLGTRVAASTMAQVLKAHGIKPGRAGLAVPRLPFAHDCEATSVAYTRGASGRVGCNLGRPA